MIRINLLAPERATKKKSGAAAEPGFPRRERCRATSCWLCSPVARRCSAPARGGCRATSSRTSTPGSPPTPSARPTSTRSSSRWTSSSGRRRPWRTRSRSSRCSGPPRRARSTCSTRSPRRCPTTCGSPRWTRPGGTMRFSGQSNSLAAVADYISALQSSGWFPQVELVSSQEANALVTFTLSGYVHGPRGRGEAEGGGSRGEGGGSTARRRTPPRTAEVEERNGDG